MQYMLLQILSHMDTSFTVWNILVFPQIMIHWFKILEVLVAII